MVTTENRPHAPNVLVVWVIYERPRDFPTKYVVRRWCGLSPDAKPLLFDSLREARQAIPTGLFRLPQQQQDDPVILETWL